MPFNHTFFSYNSPVTFSTGRCTEKPTNHCEAKNKKKNECYFWKRGENLRYSLINLNIVFGDFIVQGQNISFQFQNLYLYYSMFKTFDARGSHYSCLANLQSMFQFNFIFDSRQFFEYRLEWNIFMRFLFRNSTRKAIQLLNHRSNE